ncbi:hypothetical protein LPJ61_006771 [Coemansia biformis]|uniref:Uncharacterized protein n=1 Tax=Coemansia biformis TaxID=1286918 RepID=A0A9W7XTH1_9FUNG|nr:hypothetical protein LPJ61_006771 [Coemansia biformis]
MRAGEGYYIPVCPADVIAQAGSTPAMALQPGSCGYGIQLTPLPQNAARSLYSAARTLFRAILSTANVPPASSSMAGPGGPGMMQPSTVQPGMPGMAQPGMPGMAQPGMPGMAQPGMAQPGMYQPGMAQPNMPGMKQPGTPTVPNMVGMPAF